MARKNLKEDPPSVSSEEESEVETTDEEKEETEQEPNDNEDEAGAEQEQEEEEEGSDEEEEKKQPRSDAGDSSDSESDSESEPATASDYTIKPIVSKPMPNSPAPKKSAPAQTPPKPTTRSKRPAAVSDPNPNDPKKKKATRGGKLWSEGDVLAILKGIIDFKDKKGIQPNKDPRSFYELVKNNLEVEVSQRQLIDKVRKLRLTFLKNVTQKGYAHVFTKPHEAESFQLSNIIWEEEANGGASPSTRKSKKKLASLVNEENAVVSKKKEKKKEKVVMDADPDPDQYPCFMKFLSDEIEIEDSMESVLASIGNSKAKEFEDKCMKLQLEEAELSIKKSDLMRIMRKFRFEELDLHEKKLYLIAEQLKLLKDAVAKE